MKISKIHIASFGKLRDYSAEFEGGLNCIERENEFGKSTILAFVRAMFYGFPPKSTSNVKDYSRGKYTPWGTKGFGGSISFRHEGRDYILERTFFARKSEDHVSLSDARSGAQIEPGDREIGEFLFDIGEAEFVNTVFVGQMASGFTATGRNTESVSERLTNLAATGSETYSFDTADKNLKEAAAALLALRGNGGRIRELEKEREGLLEEQQQADEQMLRLEEVSSRIDILSLECERIITEEQRPAGARRAALKIQIEDAVAKLKTVEAKRIETLGRQKYLADIIFRQQEHERTMRQQALRREEYIRQIEAESVQAGKELSETISTEEKCSENYEVQLNSLLERQRAVSEQLLTAENSHRTKEQAISAIQTEIKEVSGFTDPSAGRGAEIEKYRRNVLLAAGTVAVLLVIAITGGIIAVISNRPQWMWTLMLISPATGIFSLTYFAVMRRRKEYMKQRTIMEKYSAQLEQCNRESSELSGKEQELRMQLDNLKTQYNAVREREKIEKEHYREKRDSLSTRIESLTVRLKNIRAEEQVSDSADSEMRFSTEADSADRVDPNEELAYISKELGHIDAQVRDTDALIRALQQEDQRQKAAEDMAGNSIAAHREEIAHLSGGREKIESHLPVRSEIEEKILLTEERIERARAYHRSLLIAGDAMKSASDEMERIFAPKVNELAGKYLSVLTGGRYSSIRFDRDFHVEVATDADVSFRNSDYFSGGTVDQIYLALRLAISDLIHPEGDKMPLLLDDALVQYDDKRAIHAVRLLTQLSVHRQIILFTCHNHTSERIRDAAGEMKKA